jgi:hypothetical protein
MFHSPQITFYSTDLNRLRDFYLGLGFEQRFQHPRDRQPIHVELTLDGFNQPWHRGRQVRQEEPRAISGPGWPAGNPIQLVQKRG